MNLYCLIVVLFIINNSYCERVSKKIYEPIQGDLACFKRFNGTHEIGCGSKFWGNVGVLHLIDSSDSFEWFLKKGPHAYYVLAILPEFFTPVILEEAWNSGKLTGALLINSKNFTRPSSFHFSGELSCPNRETSLYKDTSYSEYCEKNPWNPKGSSILYMNWQFPIFYINNEGSIENILKCYNNFNKPLDNGEAREWPLCAVEMKSNMFGTTSSEVCLRRSQSFFSSFDRNYCDPLEDINIYSPVLPLKEIEEKSVIIVATAADASSMFDNVSPGAESAITGLVTLLATAEALCKFSDDFNTSTKNVIFVIYEGEAWDYIGSSRMVYDMSKNQFPYEPIENQEDQMSQLNLTHIDAVIDLKQLGLLSKTHSHSNLNKLFIHTDPISGLDKTVFERNEFISKIFISEAVNYNLEIEISKNNESNNGLPLPPSSLQSFLKKANISGFVLSDHHQEYKNKFYESIYDNSANVNFKSNENSVDETDKLHKNLADVASSIASSLYNLLTGRQKKVEADPTIVNNLLYCYLENTNCSFFRNHSDNQLIHHLYPKPAKMYVSVKRGEHYLSYMTGKILSYFMGKEVDLNETMCHSNSSSIYSHEYFPFIDNGTCLKSSLHTSSALSPAFIIDDYDWKSGEYSSWTESTWQVMEARLFLKPSQSEEIWLVLGGILSVVLSVITVHILNSKAGLIFLSEIPPTPC